MGAAPASDILIFAVVLALRLLVPLAIPRYPLPGILTAFLLDAVDNGIFQRFTNLNLDFYQSYDKALDNYYLTIAYISTLRNWTNRYGFKVSRFLFYYRLVGAVVFELSGVQQILLLSPRPSSTSSTSTNWSGCGRARGAGHWPRGRVGGC